MIGRPYSDKFKGAKIYGVSRNPGLGQMPLQMEFKGAKYIREGGIEDLGFNFGINAPFYPLTILGTPSSTVYWSYPLNIVEAGEW